MLRTTKCANAMQFLTPLSTWTKVFLEVPAGACQDNRDSREKKIVGVISLQNSQFIIYSFAKHTKSALKDRMPSTFI